MIEIDETVPTWEGWERAIYVALNVGGFTQTDKARAGGWDTCATSELPQEIERMSEYGEPSDRMLRILGMAFYHAVTENAVSAASQIWKAINVRAQDLVPSLSEEAQEVGVEN